MLIAFFGLENMKCGMWARAAARRGVLSMAVAVAWGVGTAAPAQAQIQLPQQRLDVTSDCTFKWYQPEGLHWSKQDLVDGRPIFQEADVVWQGSGPISPEAFVGGEHALVALMQGRVTTIEEKLASCRNAVAGKLPTPVALRLSGVGALVGEGGLAIELWSPPDAWNSVNRAAVWSRDNPSPANPETRCATLVPDGPTDTMCLSTRPGDGDHISVDQPFRLEKGQRYRVQLLVQAVAESPGWARLNAALLKVGGDGQTTPVQTGQLHFIIEQYFPKYRDLMPTVGRAATAQELSPLDFWLTVN